MKNILRIATLVFLPLLPAFGQTVKDVFAYPTSAPGPIGSLAQGRDGSLYTVASGFGYGVANTDGAIFNTSINGNGSRALHLFSGADGTEPFSGLTLAMDGNYYGATYGGGSSNFGVLFEISPGGVYTVLHEFTGLDDGWAPAAVPIQASDGSLYGTTLGGSVSDGIVYKYSPSTGMFTTIFSFNPDGSQGYQIEAPLIQGSDGNLYGTTEFGGTSNCGTVFELSLAGSLLQSYSFPCGTGGQILYGPVVQASDGNFYGTTFYGGNITRGGECQGGCGTIFKLSDGVVSILYNFSGYSNDGAFPEWGLTEGTDGNLYGSTERGGRYGLGTLFQISTSGQYKLLYSFPVQVGAEPSSVLLQHTNGSFYGTLFNNSTYRQGSLYSLDMGLGPFIALVRYTGRIGQPVQILGQGLTGSTAVTVNGVAATSFKVVSDTYMTAVVPTGVTTGPVVVTTSTGTLTSNHNLRIVQ